MEILKIKPVLNMALMMWIGLVCVFVVSCAQNTQTSIKGAKSYVKGPKMLNPENFNEADQALCSVAGGAYHRGGILGYFNCVMPYPDGGKTCTDNDQCVGYCRAPEGAHFTDPDASTDQTGQCQMSDNPFGCHANVRKGRVEPTLCVD